MSTSATTTAAATAERVEATVDGELVPGLLWRADVRDPAPLVLLGHGRTGDKDDPWMADLAGRITAGGRHAICIDAPDHGERREPGATDWPRPEPAEALPGWRAILDLLAHDPLIDTGRLGYWGISMGTALGVGLVADDDRFRAAVFGQMYPDWPAPPGTAVRAAAAALDLPVLMLAAWGDSRVALSKVVALFELIGSADKQMIVHPGDHAEIPDDVLQQSVDFLARHL